MLAQFNSTGSCVELFAWIGPESQLGGHKLRHHYASVLLAAGESAIAVTARLGHDDATMALKVYGNLMLDPEHRSRKAIDSAWATASTKSLTAPRRPR